LETTYNLETTKPQTEEFTLPSGKKAEIKKLTARDAINAQKEFAARKDLNADDFILIMLAKSVKIDGKDLFMEDFDNGNLDAIDYLALYTKFSMLSSSSKPGEANPI
jgi:hypothetical protein